MNVYDTVASALRQLPPLQGDPDAVARAKRMVDEIVAWWPTRPLDEEAFLRDFIALVTRTGAKPS